MASVCLYNYCTTTLSMANVPGLHCVGICEEGGFVETAEKPFRPDCGACGDVVDEQSCPPLCDDGARSGFETGIDCGGPDCAPCKAYQPCVQNEDCASGVCQPSVIYCGDVPCCAEGEDGHPPTYKELQ